MSAPQFVAVGHVTLDRFGDEIRPGGSALYAAITAHRLGLTAGILTSHADDFPLDAIPPQIEVVTVPAAETTAFEHALGDDGERRLTVRAAARPLGADDVPDDWRDAAIVLLAPVAGEVDPLVATRFDDASIGASVQGWLRALGPDGLVVSQPWDAPEFLVGRLQALFASLADIRDDEAAALEWFQRIPMGVLTAGKAGALLFVNGQRYELAVHAVDEVDATGAGDVFAATFMIRYHLGDDVWDAARAAACAAALAVSGEGWSRVPDRAQLDEAIAYWRSREEE